MTLRDIAGLIPQEYRKEILITGVINTALASNANAGMVYLGKIWKSYIAPQEDLNCGLCLERILNNFKQVQPILAEMEKESRLLDGL